MKIFTRKMYTIISLNRELSEAEGADLAKVVSDANPNAEVSHRQVFPTRCHWTGNVSPKRPYSVINIRGSSIDFQATNQAVTSRGYGIAHSEIDIGAPVYNSDVMGQRFGGPVKLGRFTDPVAKDAYMEARRQRAMDNGLILLTSVDGEPAIGFPFGDIGDSEPDSEDFIETDEDTSREEALK